MDIKNLNQLKKAMKGCPKFEIVGHCRPECIGQIRRVTLANTQGFYSGMEGQPDHEINRNNNGLGLVLSWGKADVWGFQDGLCTQYFKGTEHTVQNAVISFRILEEAA